MLAVCPKTIPSIFSSSNGSMVPHMGPTGEKDHQRWDETTSTCTTSSGTRFCSEGGKDNTLSKIYGTGRVVSLLILPHTSELLCTSTASVSLLLCFSETDRKEGEQLLASHSSMSQFAECAGQEA